MNIAMISSWHVHARGYANDFKAIPGCSITAVWDENPDAGRAWAEELGCPFVADYEEILADPSIDGIAMTAPTCLHGDMLLRAAKAGKHIFTEKVLTIGTEEALAIAQAVKENHLKFVVSFPHRCRPELLYAKSLADSGKLGQITYARVRNAHNGSVAGWLPDYFYDEALCGGGAMIDLGAHPMYLLNWILGQPKSVPVACAGETAQASSTAGQAAESRAADVSSVFTQVTGRGVEDNAVSVISYENGAIGVSETGFVTPNDPFVLEIRGTKGGVSVRGSEVSYCCGETEDKWVTVDTLPEALPSPQQQWVDAVTKGTPITVGTIDDAVALTILMEGAYKAARSGERHEF